MAAVRRLWRRYFDWSQGAMSISHDEFISMLGSEFPEVLAGISDCNKGLLHCEMADFRRIVEQAIDNGSLWAAEKCFRFVDRVLNEADLDVRNAIEVSFLEDFALGEFTQARHEAVRRRMPRHLRDILIGIDEKWR
jgi:hypothetical protein